MSRRDELLKIFEDLDENVLMIVSPMIDELIFIEDQLAELRTKPFIKYHPTIPTKQKATDASKLYKNLLAQQKDIVRILCSQLHKSGESSSKSPLSIYLESVGRVR